LFGFENFEKFAILGGCNASFMSFIKMPTDKLDRLKALFSEMDRALIAYSGGIDSTLVAKIAFDVLGDRALAVTANSPSLLPDDLEDARIQARLPLCCGWR